MSDIFTEISFIVLIAAVLAWLSSLARQPVILGYVLCGMMIGPSGLKLVDDVELVNDISHIGITLLLFLAGMVLHPQRLRLLFKSSIIVTLCGCLVFFLAVFLLLRMFGYRSGHCVYAGLALMFSSTILVVKLLPTTTLHQRHMGSVCIAILIAQDLIAVAILVVIRGTVQSGMIGVGLLLPLKTLLLIAFSVAFEQFGLRKMMKQSDRFPEVLYMLCLGWCLGMAVASKYLGLSYEVGAFLGGVALARNPLSRFLTEQLKPIRDFFLMFFFFVLGARLNLLAVPAVIVPALAVTALLLAVKGAGFIGLFRMTGEKPAFARETGIRLSQASEFGLIIIFAAQSLGKVNEEIYQLVQLVVILSMLVSSYIVIFRFHTPLGTVAELKQD
jgi:Kef-type K+ transport system membrane component KefB